MLSISGMILCSCITANWLKNKLLFYNQQLTEKNLWSSWRIHLSLKEIKDIPQETITAWLIQDIKDCYSTSYIKSFYNNIQQEEHLLREIAFWYHIFSILGIVDVKTKNDIHNRIELLEYLQKITYCWEHAI